MKSIIEHLSELRVIPFATIDDPEKAIPLAQALLAGGSDVVSVSFQSPTAAESIQQIATAFPEMWVGAGSVTGVDEISAAHIAGARFALAPGFDPIVVDAAFAAGLPVIPGMMTPSNLSRSLLQGCKIQNFFPATVLGPEMLKAILSAFRHKGVKVVATGGIDADNIADWLAIPDVIACGASWICPEELIAAEAWDEITARMQETLAKVHF
ncbi:MAG: bifunctional 4-hydroxy-2-oxoglutarate aldolase/2-dehydro-3-deoxy-phosphogluconate aldolase [Opitutales bacterium]|nr:bifunctional 4-hydroxy-2-oxoglutarate aldolase/2-dehydro-3-deoxy-phosphogluconate aldolase [Opitutales bacterium]